MVCSRRFWVAPRVPRKLETWLMAASITAIAALAAPALESKSLACPEASAVMNEAPVPSTAAFMSDMVTEMVSPPLAPTWKLSVEVPFSRLVPLNLVSLAMSSMAETSSSSSAWAAATEAPVSPPLAPVLEAWTARSRARCSMEWTSVRAPSAVCITLMPSWALRVATLRPPTCERRFSLMTRPAASSPARLMRKPEESFSRDLPSEFWVPDRLR